MIYLSSVCLPYVFRKTIYFITVPSSFVFQSVDCSVKAVQKEGLDVKLSGYNSGAYLPKVHLSDLPALSNLMAGALAKEDVLDEVVVLGAQNNNVLVSNKRTVKRTTGPQTKLGMFYMGCV